MKNPDKIKKDTQNPKNDNSPARSVSPFGDSASRLSGGRAGTSSFPPFKGIDEIILKRI